MILPTENNSDQTQKKKKNTFKIIPLDLFQNFHHRNSLKTSVECIHIIRYRHTTAVITRWLYHFDFSKPFLCVI